MKQPSSPANVTSTKCCRKRPPTHYGWTIENLLSDPGQIKRTDPEDDNMGSDLQNLVYDLRDAREFRALLENLQGRCEQCGAPSEKLFECDKAYLCERCSDKWENE